MRYLKNLHSIDIFLFISFLPLFFALPIAMKIFVIVALFLVYKRNLAGVVVFGILALFVSFYNFWELKNFEVYVKFLVSLLIWAVYMQRTQGVNSYLLFSPYLFVGLSVVVYQNIYMLFYVLFEIFVFLYFFIKNYSSSALKETFFIFLFSLPLVVVLFFFFPRVSQTNFTFGFSSNKVESGFSNIVNSSTSNVKPTSYPVVEFKLDRNYGNLYLRGAVFYIERYGVWVKSYWRDRLVSKSKEIEYFLKEYPTTSKVIFAIDLPIWSEYGELKNFILFSKEMINSPLFVKVRSALEYKLAPVFLPKFALEYNKNFNKNAQKLIKPILKIKSSKKRLEALIEIFKNQKIVYTLKPGKVDGKNVIDYLFEHKRGYCTHFASAFAIFARMAGIPSRLVSGYLAKPFKEGYYKVYSKDAHVWVEVLIDGVWHRIDPVEFSYKVDKTTQKELKTSSLSNYLSMVRFFIEEWILRYNKYSQERFIKFFLKNWYYFVGVFILFVILIFALFIKLNKRAHILSPLYKKLGREPQKESVYNFLKSFNDERLDKINELYHKITFYKASKEDIKKLKRLIKEFK